MGVTGDVLFNLKQDFNLFSLGVGLGWAFSRNVAIGYVHHVAGRETFNWALTVNLRFLFGRRKDKS